MSFGASEPACEALHGSESTAPGRVGSGEPKVDLEAVGAPKFPRDIWIDVETGAWGLVSNLHLAEQSALPVGDAIHSAAEVRCAGIDHGVTVAALLRGVDHA